MKYGYSMPWIKKLQEYLLLVLCSALVGVMHINNHCDWLGRQLFQFHGQCHISLAYNLRGRFNGNESWSLSEFNAIQVWTRGGEDVKCSNTSRTEELLCSECILAYWHKSSAVVTFNCTASWECVGAPYQVTHVNKYACR